MPHQNELHYHAGQRLGACEILCICEMGSDLELCDVLHRLKTCGFCQKHLRGVAGQSHDILALGGFVEDALNIKCTKDLSKYEH